MLSHELERLHDYFAVHEGKQMRLTPVQVRLVMARLDSMQDEARQMELCTVPHHLIDHNDLPDNTVSLLRRLDTPSDCFPDGAA